MLQITNLVSYLGRVEILKGISIHVQEREIAALIGPNGAGKSTLLNTIAGLVPAYSGEILWNGKNIANLSASQVVRQGITLVPEGRQLFFPMSVMDNLTLGYYSIFRMGCKADLQEQYERVFGLFPILKQRRKQLAGTLSGGEQQMLAIARALMSKPKLILLDEPSIGIAPRLVEEIFEAIESLRKQDLTVLLVEQNARLALDLADRGYVVETGQIVMSGDCSELKLNHEIERAYLGKAYREIWE